MWHGDGGAEFDVNTRSVEVGRGEGKLFLVFVGAVFGCEVLSRYGPRERERCMCVLQLDRERMNKKRERKGNEVD